MLWIKPGAGGNAVNLIKSRGYADIRVEPLPDDVTGQPGSAWYWLDRPLSTPRSALGLLASKPDSSARSLNRMNRQRLGVIGVIGNGPVAESLPQKYFGSSNDCPIIPEPAGLAVLDDQTAVRLRWKKPVGRCPSRPVITMPVRTVKN